MQATGTIRASPASAGCMRATAMDELPQLWNIFRGDMSFVGPRALRPGEIEVDGRRPAACRSKTFPASRSGSRCVPG